LAIVALDCGVLPLGGVPFIGVWGRIGMALATFKHTEDREEHGRFVSATQTTTLMVRKGKLTSNLTSFKKINSNLTLNMMMIHK
jgi:hypothetical protein